MAKLITYKKAKEEIKRLQWYCDLVESYQTDTLEKIIIKEYCLTNSMPKIIENLNYLGVTRESVVSIINGKPQDELHKIVKSGYLYKTRPSRR